MNRALDAAYTVLSEIHVAKYEIDNIDLARILHACLRRWLLTR